eukprot:6179117-Pleurochrysis_carterae.AAC.2
MPWDCEGLADLIRVANGLDHRAGSRSRLEVRAKDVHLCQRSGGAPGVERCLRKPEREQVVLHVHGHEEQRRVHAADAQRKRVAHVAETLRCVEDAVVDCAGKQRPRSPMGSGRPGGRGKRAQREGGKGRMADRDERQEGREPEQNKKRKANEGMQARWGVSQDGSRERQRLKRATRYFFQTATMWKASRGHA